MNTWTQEMLDKVEQGAKMIRSKMKPLKQADDSQHALETAMKQKAPIVTTMSEAVAPSLFEHVPMSPALRRLMDDRVNAGMTEYKTLLMTHNGRDAKQDLKDEVADAILYCWQKVMEDGANGSEIMERLIPIGEILMEK